LDLDYNEAIDNFLQQQSIKECCFFFISKIDSFIMSGPNYPYLADSLI